MAVSPPACGFIPDQFSEPCAANPDAVIELPAHGSVITMTSTGGEKGVRNSSLSSGYVSSFAAEAGAGPLKLLMN